MSSDVVRALEPLVATLERLSIAYRIGGSVASSALGVPRSTIDVDLECAIENEHVVAFVAALKDSFYVDEGMIRDAIARRASFNLIFLETVTKIDVFVHRFGTYDREAFGRGVRLSLEPGTREFDLVTAEDIVLRKLDWYRLGDGVSERQWLDVVGVLRVQGPRIDREYLRRWADLLDLTKLLERALAEANASPP